MSLQHSEQARRFYQSKAWKKTRQAYFDSQFGLCERCSEAGLIVHHKIYIDINNVDNAEITLDWGNLEVVCQTCHNKEHFRKHEVLREGFGFDAEGNLIEID